MRGPDYKGSAKFTLDGAGRMVQIFKEFPQEGFYKPVREGFKKAALPVKKAMISKLPSEIKAVKKAIIIKQSRRSLVTNVGVYAKQGVYVNRRGERWDPWTLAYWFNYGTYANRSPLHSFQSPRRGRSRNKPGGIRPEFFIEDAWEASKDMAAAELEKYWADYLVKLCNKYNIKQ
jgi:hypothetical protein